MYSLNEDGSNLADAKYFYVQTIKVYQYRTNVYFFYLLKSIIMFNTIQTSLKSELNIVKTLFRITHIKIIFQQAQKSRFVTYPVVLTA